MRSVSRTLEKKTPKGTCVGSSGRPPSPSGRLRGPDITDPALNPGREVRGAGRKEGTWRCSSRGGPWMETTIGALGLCSLTQCL